jgi:hypothetical protein
MVKKIRAGFFGKKVTKYKPLWCDHADWVIFKSLAGRENRTMIEMIHEALSVYLECTEQNHKGRIESLENQKTILAAELLKYQDQFGKLPRKSAEVG